MTREDERASFLLSGGHLSGAQRDRVLVRVLRVTAKRRRGSWKTWFTIAALPVAAAASLIVVFGLRRAVDTDPPWRASKGASGSAFLKIRCPDQVSGKCRIGDRMVFEVDGDQKAGFLIAYAQDEAGRRIWYFPRADGRAAVVPATPGHLVLDDVVRIGPEHAPGRYTVHLQLLDRPVDREALLAGHFPARATAETIVEVSR